MTTSFVDAPLLTASWQRDPDFAVLWQIAADRTALPPAAVHVLHRLTRQTSQLGGAMAEVGVWRGGSAWVMAHSRERDVPLHLFDSFRGLPAADPRRDALPVGAFADTSLAEVQAWFAEVERVHVHAGFFPATAYALLREQYCLVHCDASTWQATLDCLRTFHCRLLRGGALLVEGYGGGDTPGVAEAVDEFYANKAEVPLLLPTGQVLAIKL